MPYGPDEANLYVNLAGFASELDAQLDSFNIQTNQTKTAPMTDNLFVKDKSGSTAVVLRTTLVSIKFSAMSYTKVKHCLELMESNTKLLDVQSFQFNPTEGTLELTLATYYLK